MLKKNRQGAQDTEEKKSEEERVKKENKPIRIPDSERVKSKPSDINKSQDKGKKDPNTIEGNLAILSNRTKLNILDFLSDNGRAMKYSEIMYEIDKREKTSVNLNYHLKDLQDSDMIEGDKDIGYYLSPYGQKIVRVLLDFSHVVATRGNPVFIRNSFYEKEEFSEDKIVLSLMREAGFTERDAKLIAKETRTRLFASKVKYLTTPLIREYINAILIEHGLEEKRHSLTRLGLPPHDFRESLLNTRLFDYPDELLLFSGSLVAEQYLLLNGIPRAIADMIIDGQMYLNNLSTFLTKPLSVALDAQQFFNYLFAGKELVEIAALDDFSFFIMMDNSVKQLMEFFFGGIVIMNFEEFITVWEISVKKPISKFINLILRPEYQHKVVLNIELDGSEFQINQLINILEGSIKTAEDKYLACPTINIILKKTIIKQLSEMVEKNNYKSGLADYILTVATEYPSLFTIEPEKGWKKERMIAFPEHTISSIKTDMGNPGSIILDKITIDLASFCRNSRDIETFLEMLDHCFQKITFLFEIKYKIIKQSRQSFIKWNDLVKNCFDNRDPFEAPDLFSENQAHQFICSIGIIGIHEALELCSGIDMPTSEAYKDMQTMIFGHIADVINGNNNNNKNVKFVLAESDSKIEYVKRTQNEHLTNPSEDTDYIEITSSHPSLYQLFSRSQEQSILELYSPYRFGNLALIPGIRLVPARSKIEQKKNIVSTILNVDKAELPGVFFIHSDELAIKKEGKVFEILRNGWNYYRDDELNDQIINQLKQE